MAKEEVAGTNTAEEKVEKARSLTRLTQHGGIESGVAVAGLTVRLLPVCGLLPVAGLTVRLLPVAGLTVRLLAVTSLLVITVTGLLAVTSLLAIARLLTVTGLLTVRLLRSRHDVS